MNRYALIVAGGKGLRMGNEIPKQFLPLDGKPVLMHTLEAFAAIPGLHIVLVLPSVQFDYWHKLSEAHAFAVEHTLVEGGETRFHSVKNGLDIIPDGALVAIHDGVRPLVSGEVIGKSFETATNRGNAVTAVRLKDSIREVTLLGNKNVNRNNYYLVQTPQTFMSTLIKRAYAKPDHFNFTDDASVLEESGHTIHLLEGSYSNIKITTPEDLLWAEALLKSRS
jgi:2-C-methyl-D-erythritol 4-phosphate cytidylyltransferase